MLIQALQTSPSCPDRAISARKPPLPLTCFTQGLFRKVGAFHLTCKHTYSHKSEICRPPKLFLFLLQPSCISCSPIMKYHTGPCSLFLSRCLHHCNGAHLVSISTYMSSQRERTGVAGRGWKGRARRGGGRVCVDQGDVWTWSRGITVELLGSLVVLQNPYVL